MIQYYHIFINNNDAYVNVQINFAIFLPKNV